MEVKIDKRYDLPVSLDQAWAVLRNVRSTVTCMPGAEVTEQLDDTHYKGQVRSRIGPAVMTFAGQIEVLDLDTGSRTMAMLGKGSDTSGSSASMDLRTALLPGESPQTCVLLGQATITVSGRLAQFGSRLLLPVSETMLKTFVANFSSKAATIEFSDTALPPSAESTPPTQINVLAVLWETLRQWWSRLWNRHPS